MTQPKVIIVILNYNGKANTLACLKSLAKAKYSNSEIVVVDNASVDNSIDAIRKSYPRIRIIRNKTNLGYAEGNNRGIDWALKRRADFILILNNDTEVTYNFLDELIKVSKDYPEAALFGPQLLYPGKRPRIWYAGGKIYWPLAQIRLFKKGVRADKIKDRSPLEVNFVTGAAFFVRAEAIREVGKFDSRFFLYWEETDWCARATRRGYKFIYVPSSIIYHKEGATTGWPKSARMDYYFTRNNLLFARKNLPIWWWPTFLLFFFLRILIKLPISIVYLIALRPYRLLGWFYSWLGIFDFIRGKFGRRF